MAFVRDLGILLGGLILACGTAGLFGAVHNQISYGVSAEYFHAFKFPQFGISETFHNRLGASLVGFLASWWMGVLIFLALLPKIDRTRQGTTWYAHYAKTFLTVSLVAMGCGLLGLIYGLGVSDTTPLSIYGTALSAPYQFRVAGMMHNFSYLGGLLGIVGGYIYMLSAARQRVRGSEGI